MAVGVTLSIYLMTSKLGAIIDYGIVCFEEGNPIALLWHSENPTTANCYSQGYYNVS